MNNIVKYPFLQVLSLKNFLKLWCSQLLVLIAQGFVNFIIILRIFEVTHSALAVSLVWLIYALPAIIFGPISGAFIDLVEKRRVLIWTNVIQTLVVFSFILAKENIILIYIIIFIYSLINQLYIPAEGSTLPGIVPEKLLSSANSIFMFTIYGASLISYGSAGFLVRGIGRRDVILLASLALGLAAMVCFFLPSIGKKKREEMAGISGFFDKVKEGYLFIKKSPTIFFPLILLILGQMIIGILTVLVPSFATQVLSIEFTDIGLILVLPVALGALIGAQGVIWALKRVRKKKIITLGLCLESIGLILLGLLVPNLYFGKIQMASLIAFFLGISLVCLLIPTQTLIQEETPEEFRGRVFGVLGFMITLGAVLPIFLTAAIADLLGVAWIIAIIGLGVGVIALYATNHWS